MKKFEYLRIESYISNKKWVINYCGNELSIDYQDAIFAELGIEGWEMISTSTYIDGDIINTALIPIRADTTVGVSNTSREIYYFKKEIETEIKYSNVFQRQIDYIKSISNSNNQELEKEINNILNSKKYVAEMKDILSSNGYQEGDAIIDRDYSFYKTEKKEQVDKGLFGKESKKIFIINKRIDLTIYEENINYKYYEQVDNDSWRKYGDIDISKEDNIEEFKRNLKKNFKK